MSPLFSSRRRERTSGDPPSGNGASSFHLWWEVPYGERLRETSAVLTVLEPPQVDRLYFWALQVSFVKPDGGGAHLGLQHHPRFPGRRAANWGGYNPSHEGGVLPGSVSPLPSTPDDVNTRDFSWEPGRRYRLAVVRVPGLGPGGRIAWRGTITDTGSGDETHVRDLYSWGEYLRGPVVWTEAFARCDDPPVTARWSDLRAVGEDGSDIVVSAVSVNYQAYEAGGCTNTNVSVDGDGWYQTTAAERVVPTGARLSLPRR